MKRNVAWLVVAVTAVLLGVLLYFRAAPEAPASGSASSSAPASSRPAPPPPSVAAPTAHYPRAVRDQAKRDEIRARLLGAIAEANAKAARPGSSAEEGSGAGSAASGETRGNRETNDLKELGRFIQQAIKEDFLPMARSCALDLLARDPKARGSATIDFKLVGDKKIGGVVDSASVDATRSTLHDARFETCIRESLYGVYFDPPPAGGEATLDFPITILDDGGVADDVDDFSQIRDRRNEK